MIDEKRLLASVPRLDAIDVEDAIACGSLDDWVHMSDLSETVGSLQISHGEAVSDIAREVSRLSEEAAELLSKAAEILLKEELALVTAAEEKAKEEAEAKLRTDLKQQEKLCPLFGGGYD